MAEKKNKLTPAEERLLVEYRQFWFNVGTDTKRADRAKTEKLIHEFYTFTGKNQGPKEFVWRDSPFALTKEEPYLRELTPIFGSLESYWIGFYKFGNEILPKSPYTDEENKKLNLWAELAQNCFIFWPYENVCFISEKPTSICMETDRESPRLHAIGKPAIKFADGYAIWRIRGVTVTKDIAMGNFKAKDIQKQPNVEVQRVMIDMYGEGKYIEDIGAKPIHEDRFGRLYQVKFQNDSEDLFMIRLVDSTPQPSGEYKIYWLNINPEHYNGAAGKIAHAAVASTWRNKDSSLYFDNYLDYDPEVES